MSTAQVSVYIGLVAIGGAIASAIWVVAGASRPTQVALRPGQILDGWATSPNGELDLTTGMPLRIVRLQDSAEMCLVPSGAFQMGKSRGDSESEDDEGPSHTVVIASAFYMDANEVSNAQFARFVRDSGYTTEAEGRGRAPKVNAMGGFTVSDGVIWRDNPDGGADEWDSRPVVLVTWNDAIAYCNWVGASLPTEAQFEWALRGAESGGWFPWGNSLTPPGGAGNFADESSRRAFPRWSGAVVGYDDGYARAAPAGRSSRNRYGIRDLSGNVEEWCMDCYHPGYYRASPRTDPEGPPIGGLRVVRGGSWMSPLKELRCSFRHFAGPTDCWPVLGFRCVRKLPSQ